MTPFINRELSWLSFNERVLAESVKPGSLPLEKLKFLAITASNLDEFFMIRVAYLNDRKSDSTPDDAGLTAGEQLVKVLEQTGRFQLDQAASLSDILSQLRENGISFLKMEELDETQSNFARKYFEDEILPVITPLAIDPGRPFPLLSSLSMNIAVRMHDAEGKNVYAVIQVPSILTRFIPLPVDSGRCFLPLEELIAHHLPDICSLHEIKAYGCFRIMRSADFDADEDTDNLLEEMKRTIKKRKRGNPIRLELSAGFDEKTRSFLRERIRVNRRFIIELPGFLDISAFMKIASLKGFDNLRTAPIAPVAGMDFVDCEDIFAAIRERDRMLHHPYESFGHVVDFITAAAADPGVLAIKQTLYRVSGRSEIVAALEQAAEAGKQVTVLVELKARFDEERNIKWATQLERAGCHVIYGLTGLKTHCKITLVVRREEDGIRRYLHLSTGNYNDVTARIYTDIGMFTCRPSFGADASALFNNLTGFSMAPLYSRFVVAPEHMKKFFIDRIGQEIENAANGLPGAISIKANSLLEGDVVRKLYEASEAGVKINLLIRGICSLLPINENIRVRSIVGRFLEHSRIFVFENAGDPLVYLGSADLMPRNLDRRVEVVFPVEDILLKIRLRRELELMWLDNVCAWELTAEDGAYNGAPAYKYQRVDQTGEQINSQEELINL